MSHALPVSENSALLGVERSAMGYRWLLRDGDERQVISLTQKLGIPEVLARVVVGRGIHADDTPSFLAPTLRDLLPDPFHLRDMDKASARLVTAIHNKETIAIFGDYDVDGATSTALLVSYLRALGCNPRFYIPDRIKEGYGPNIPALLALRKQGVDLLITVDCGAVSHEPLEAAHKAGLDVIVLDHHMGDVQLPKAVAVVNPNRFDEESAHRHMAAVGVTFLLVVATNRVLREAGWFQLSNTLEPNPLQWLDLVALGTVCDVVSLTGVNRAFVTQGLKILAQRQNIGLKALSDVARLDEIPSAYHLGFMLGPRINAGGRVGKSDLGVRILTTEDAGEAMSLAAELDHMNAERKTLESLALEEAHTQAESIASQNPVLLVDGNWHPGVIGIIAGRLKDKFHKPTAVVSWDGDVGKASARSVSGVDLGAAIVAARASGLLVAGGGHAMAAGFTVEREKFPALKEFLCKRLEAGVAHYAENRSLRVDALLSPQAITPDLVRRLQDAEPFGMGNPAPRFALADMRVVQLDLVGENHLRCVLMDGGVGGRAAGTRIQAIAFRALGTPLEKALVESKNGLRLHICGQLKLNSWQGNERVDLQIEDVAIAL